MAVQPEEQIQSWEPIPLPTTNLPPPPPYSVIQNYTPVYIGQFPNYYAPSVIPEGVILVPSQVTALDRPTNATYKTTNSGDIITFDPNLDYDVDGTHLGARIMEIFHVTFTTA
jgi:hypothetical protein